MSGDVCKYGGRKSFCLAAIPDEVAEVLREGGFHLLIVNSHVPTDYTETPVEEWLSTHRALYGKLASGARLSWEEDWMLFQAHHLTRDLALCVRERKQTYRGRTYKSAPLELLERGLTVKPVILYREAHERRAATYSTAYSYTQFPENTMGLQFSVATKRWWWDEAGLTHEEDITDMPDFVDFQWLKDRFGKMTKPLKFEDNERVVNTGIRVTAAAKEVLGNFFFFSDGGYHIM